MIRKKLEPFQIEGAHFLATHPYALLADEPGLGKTLQAIAAAQETRSTRNVVVCPASVRSNWATELLECTGSTYGWKILSYNEVVRDIETLGYHDLDTLILDEAHFLKTPESQRTQAIFGNKHGLARRAKRVYPLTGTPILNRPRELYPILKTLNPKFATTSFARYAQRYCGAFWDGRGLNTKGATHLGELAAMLEGFMLRRTKKQVYPDRKEPLVASVPIDLSRQDMAAVLAEEEVIGGRQAKISARYNDFSQMGDTAKLLRLLGEAMVPHVVEFVKDQLETVDKVVVFAHHRDVIMSLANAFCEAGHTTVIYWGGMTDKAKQRAIEFFQTPDCRVFIGQRQAAGQGINGLQKVCSTAVIAEPSWVPGETEQMIDRLDRIGQQDELVNAYILYARGTLQEVVVNVHRRKEAVVERVMAPAPSTIVVPEFDWGF